MTYLVSTSVLLEGVGDALRGTGLGSVAQYLRTACDVNSIDGVAVVMTVELLLIDILSVS